MLLVLGRQWHYAEHAASLWPSQVLAPLLHFAPRVVTVLPLFCGESQNLVSTTIEILTFYFGDFILVLLIFSA